MNPERLAQYVAAVIADAPPISDDDRATITRMLRPGARASEAGGRR